MVLHNLAFVLWRKRLDAMLPNERATHDEALEALLKDKDSMWSKFLRGFITGPCYIFGNLIRLGHYSVADDPNQLNCDFSNPPAIPYEELTYDECIVK